MEKGMLKWRVERNMTETDSNHHVKPEPAKSMARWISYLASWTSWPGTTPCSKEAMAGEEATLAGFRNPWPSWHKASRPETWAALQWGEDHDPCIKLAATHLPDKPPANPGPDRRPNFNNIDDWPASAASQAAALLQIEKPDFSFDPTLHRAKTTWLGHAGVLVQLAPLQAGSQPLRCLFDPIFSTRCSPSKLAGPKRTYPPPCPVEHLPAIDMVFTSHSHFDHLDLETILALWRRNRKYIRFFAPLGNKSWFVDIGISAEHVTELDWWDCAHLDMPGVSNSLKIWCTPSQHSSGRGMADADQTLWSSWFLEHPGANEAAAQPYRVFFAGDTGFQFHDSPSWPPQPTTVPLDANPPEVQEDDKFPSCPAFADIRSRLGSPHLAILPVAVGATWDFFRSFVPLPDTICPFPRHAAGMVAATHMPPWDAVRVFDILTGQEKGGTAKPETREDESSPVAVAMHWGTFVSNPKEVLKTLGQLEWACHAHGVGFGRSLPLARGREGVFLALNHGQSVLT